MLVGPVRGHPALGDQVHLPGADLHFDRRTVGAEQHRVQRLVAVGLGNGDEVAEAAIERLELRMHRAQRVVAVWHAAHHQPEAEHVHHLVEAFPLGLHLAVDAPGGLDPADQPMLQSVAGQALGQLYFHLDHRLAPHHRLAADVLFDDRVPPRIQRLEPQVLQLGLDQVHAQPLGDRRVDLQRLAGDARARLHALGTKCAHVVQAVGQLDHDHAHVARHGQQHLAEALGRRFLAVAELELVQLGDAFDQFGHVLAELGGDFVPAQRGVLDGVVQDRRDQGLHVQAQFGQHAGHRHRVGDVGLAGLAGLPGMGGGTDPPGLAQQWQLFGRQVGGGTLQLQHIGRHFFARRRRRGGDCLGGGGGGHGNQRLCHGLAAVNPNAGMAVIPVAAPVPHRAGRRACPAGSRAGRSPLHAA